MATVVLGSQWGDEGKGKLIHFLSKRCHVCARAQGGDNAGHTIVSNDKVHKFHLLPCGLLRDHTKGIVGPGTVIHLPALMTEIQNLPDCSHRIFISPRAHLIFKFHRLIDGINETSRGVKKNRRIGTTGKGIGPCYATKAQRTGMRVGELLNFENFKERYLSMLNQLKQSFPLLESYSPEDELAELEDISRVIPSMILDTSRFINEALKSNKNVLIEGANGALLDIDLGTYPFVTSSNTTVGGLCTGLGISTKCISTIIGVVKAYCTRVGHGPFPTEITQGPVMEHLSSNGAEYGTTTGRKRRCGWLDLCALKYVNMINSFDQINLTKLDVLTGLDVLKVCVSYKWPNGMIVEDYPVGTNEFEQIVPEYVNFPGWKTDISKCVTFEDLPVEAQNYVNFIEDFVNVPSNHSS
ncbi:Adenylosuccinate synthetase [Rozella allomycis CSF55]|uniref:Adenylosuccinate synthetase n=1 Tax=Rozella allomycis (strain CSF55) TaxID=988480 RepID=A0A4P9YIB0_ROZAC|nr:Adenylosuccinate synthetase [Rozella allomycis CSF55]